MSRIGATYYINAHRYVIHTTPLHYSTYAVGFAGGTQRCPAATNVADSGQKESFLEGLRRSGSLW
jgi:hypothetical protein